MEANPPQHHRYRVLRPLARGGMAMVHLAEELDTGRQVALKQLVVPEGTRPAEMRLRFQQEFLVAARLRHPNVVAHHDYADPQDGGMPFFTMEYLPGPGLEECIPCPVGQVLAWLPGLLAGLGYLHAHGVAHCDLKPENLRVGADGLVRVMDLGLVSRLGRPATGVQGTLPYMAPEVIRRAPVDRRSDLYALGAVLYHLLAGVPPFEGSPREVLAGHLDRAPEPLGRLVPGLPHKLEALIMKLLAKDALARFQSAEEVARFLAATGALHLPGESEEDATLFPAPLVGRQAELKRLAEALEQARLGQVVDAWVHGPAEADHGPLLAEFGVRAQLSGATVLRANFHPRMAPFESLREVVGGLVAHAGPEGEAPAMRLAERLSEAAAARRDGDDPHAGLLRVFNAFLALAKVASASGPLVLSFREAHLADATWREWLEYLRRNGAGLPMVVLASSHDEADPEVFLDPDRVVVELEPLPTEAIAEAARAILGQSEGVPERAEELAELAKGWPGRLAQALAALVAAGALRKVGGAWVWPQGALQDAMPATTTLAVAQGLGPLAEALREVLGARGRATGLDDWWAMARRFLGLGPDEAGAEATPFLEAVRALEEGGWVEVQEDGAYAFAAERQAPWQAECPEAVRRRAHGAVAAELEAQAEANPQEAALRLELGFHALAAGDPQSAPGHALESARIQTRLLGLEEAEALLREALALVGEAPSEEAPARRQLRLELWALRAEVARLAGDVRLASRAYGEAEAWAEALGHPGFKAQVRCGRGELALGQSRPDEAIKAAGLTLQDLGVEGAQSPEAARAHELLARAALAMGDLDQADAHAAQALPLAESLGLSALARDLLALRGYLLVARDEGRDHEGLAMLGEAVSRARQAEAQLDLTASTSFLGQAHLLLGQGSEAREAFQRNVTLCAEVGAAPHEEATARMRLMQVAVEVGDAREARRQAAPAGALARMLRDRKLLAQVRLLEGMAALQEGDVAFYEDAAGWVEAALQDAAAAPLEAQWEACRAEAEARLGDWPGALSAASRALNLAQAGAGHEVRDQALLLKAEALLRLGHRGPAMKALEEVGQPRHAAHQARLTLLRARLAGAERPDEARGLAAEAWLQAQRAGATPLMGQAAIQAAQLCATPDEGLVWARRAVLAAEACHDPSLAAEAYRLAAQHAPNAAVAKLSLEAGRLAWAKATSGLTSARQSAFLAPPERRALVEALKAPQEADGDRLLALLSRPATAEGLAQGAWGLAEGLGGVGRVLLTWEDERGQPVVGAALGHPTAASPAEELQEAASGRPGAVLLPLQARPPGTQELGPWGAWLVAGLPVGQEAAMLRLLGHLGGAAWAARAHWLGRRRSPSGPLVAPPPQSPPAQG